MASPTILAVRAVLLAVASGGALVLAFPPYGQAWIVIPAMVGLLAAIRLARTQRGAASVGFGFGIAFFGLLYPWIGELGIIALVPLVLVEAAFISVFAWLVKRWIPTEPVVWGVSVVGLWALVELVRSRFPVGGFEWGLLGLPMGEWTASRNAAQWIGTTGWSVLVIAVAAVGWGVMSERGRARRLHARSLGIVLACAVLVSVAGAATSDPTTGREVRVAIVQGSTPCPGRHCAGERAAVFARHLELTRSIPAGSVDFVVWPEGSTGFGVDPVLDPAIGQVIGAEARRIGAVMLVGGDRPVSDTEWINANVVFDSSGSIVGEYRKRHPVPFGEYIPARPLFDWIPELSRVPRDMIRGDGPVVFDEGFGPFGSVISFESSFARYTRDTVRAGARLMVVATSQVSYPYSRASDQLIGITRMRAAESGVDVVHSGVTGRSTFITDGGVVGPTTELVESTVIYGTVAMRANGLTLYTRLGDWVQYLAIAGGAFAMALGRRDRDAGGADRSSESPPGVGDH